ncbi:MAG TPA: PQQ-binding-like beta-propeller repeat protein [Gaiellaceae bacterium]|nr:PQQ-binding-like beta-propeller repeat protein [Gaiellaceae bacterium]
MRRRLLLAAAAIVVIAVGAAGGWYLHVKHASRDIEGSSTVEFVPAQPPPPKPVEPGIAWPVYGHDPEGTRFGNGISLAPPFRNAWTFRARTLVEFPPAVAYGRLFVANNTGTVFAVDAATGKLRWHFDSHRCVAASPAVDDHIVFESFLNEPPCNRPPSPSLTGAVIAFDSHTGRVVWRRKIAPSESSPVVVGGRVYVGDWSGKVYAFDEHTGRLVWSTAVLGQVKGGVAISSRRVFVGDYSGHVYALALRSGRILWKASAQPRFGGIGHFYATPAVAYGRVYIGSTDGKVYSFGAASGELRWSQSTGGYVYSSAAVWRDHVYAGSYSQRFTSFDAATGDVEWQFTANGPISGSATVIAGRVYFATLAGTTYALDARTGARLWTYPDGKYTPVVADSDHLYLVGYTRVHGLVESRR